MDMNGGEKIINVYFFIIFGFLKLFIKFEYVYLVFI